MANFDAILRINAKTTGTGEIKALAAAMGGLERAGTGVRAALGGLAGGVTAALGAAGLGLAAKSIIDMGDNLDELAQRTGTTVSTLSKLGLAASQSGSNLEQVSGAMVKLSRNLGNIATGGGKDAAAALQALGVSATDSSGRLRNADEVMLDVADRFQQMPDGAMKAKLAIDLFGRGAAALIPMLNQGSDAIENLNTGITETFAKNAGVYNDRLLQLRASATAFGVTLLDALLPSLIRVTTVAIGAVEQITTWFRTNKEQILGFAQNAGKGAIEIVKFFGAIYAGQKVLQAITGVFRLATLAQAAFLSLAGPVGWAKLLIAAPIMVAAGIGISESFKAAAAKAKELGQDFGELPPLAELLKQSQDDVTESLQEQNKLAAEQKAEQDKLAATAKQRAEGERQLTAAIQANTIQYDANIKAIQTRAQAAEQINEVASQETNLQLGLNNLSRTLLGNKLALAKTDEEKLRITTEIANLEKQAANIQYQATLRQIETERRLVELKKQSAEQEWRKGQEALRTALNMYKAGQIGEQRLQQELNKTRQLQAAATAAEGALASANQSANAQRQLANVNMQIATAQAQGQVQQAQQIIAPSNVTGQPRYYIETPNGRIPQYATGAFVTRPTIAQIGEGGEPEYVVPRSKALGFANNITAGRTGAQAIPAGRGGGFAMQPAVSPAATSTAAAGPLTIQVQTGPVMEINGQKYVSYDDLDRALRQTVQGVMGLQRRPTVRLAQGVL